MLEHSTQYNHWCFVHKEADFENLILKKIAKYRKIYQGVVHKNPQADVQMFEVEDENMILNFYVTQITQILQKFPLKVEAAAIAFFKRFFLKTTLLHHDPKRYIFTCIYLALKTEEIHADFAELAAQIQDPFFNRYPDFEQDVLKIINFDLKVYNSFTPIMSLLEKLKEDEKVKWDLEKFNKIYSDCLKIVRLCFSDHIMFKYSHGVISLAAFLMALKRNNISLEDCTQLQDLLNVSETAQQKIEEIRALVEKLEVISFKEKALKALRKLKNYQNIKPPKEEFAKPVEKHHHPNPPPNSETMVLEK